MMETRNTRFLSKQKRRLKSNNNKQESQTKAILTKSDVKRDAILMHHIDEKLSSHAEKTLSLISS